MTGTPPVSFDVVFRGYDRRQVHALVERIASGSVDAAQAHQELYSMDKVLRGYRSKQVVEYVTGALGPPPPPPPERFPTVLRGYDRFQVDAVISDFEAGRLSGEQLRAKTFDEVLRGYDREQVDSYIDQAAHR